MFSFLGRPLLAYLLQDLSRAEFRRVLLTDRGRDNDIQSFFGDGTDVGLHLDYSQPHPWTGTAGAVVSVLERTPEVISSPLVVIYGDSLLHIDFGEILDFHRRKGASFTIACHRPCFTDFLFDDGVPDYPRTNFGIADLAPDGRVTRFEEKPYLHTIRSTFDNPLANAAVYVVDPHAFHDLPAPTPRGLDFAFDVIPWLIARGHRVYGVDIAPGYRVDIGTLPHYLSVQLAALRGQIPIEPPFPATAKGIWIEDGASIHPSATLVAPVFVGSSVTVEKTATLASAIIGAQTIVCEGAKVRESVVLENSTIGRGASIEGSIVGSRSWVDEQTILPRGTVIGKWSRVGGRELVLSETVLRGLICGGGQQC